jgi:hypothetical protein
MIGNPLREKGFFSKYRRMETLGQSPGYNIPHHSHGMSPVVLGVDKYLPVKETQVVDIFLLHMK